MVKSHKISKHSIYGMANCSQWYPLDSSLNGHEDHNGVSTDYFCIENDCAVDMRLDLNQRNITWCVVGDNQHQRPMLFEVPRCNKGWAPIIMLSEQDTAIRVAEIPSEFFGIADQEVFRRSDSDKGQRSKKQTQRGTRYGNEIDKNSKRRERENDGNPNEQIRWIMIRKSEERKVLRQSEGWKGKGKSISQII